MELVRRYVMFVVFLAIVMPCRLDAQLPVASLNSARSLDRFLQDYAYRAFGDRPRTGKFYAAQVPLNFSGIGISVVRLRSGSLWLRGVQNYNEFEIPVGIIVKPYVVRLALVYQNLGNWSSVYYSLPGYTFLTPVIGLLAYSAANRSATNLHELELSASAKPISIKFNNISPVPGGQAAQCVHFYLNGSYRIGDLVAKNVCNAYTHGHFCVAVNSLAIAPSPAPSQGRIAPIPRPSKKGNSKNWIIIGGVVGGFVVLVLLVLFVLWLFRLRRNRKMSRMVKRSEAGEVLTTQRVGDAQLPVATMVRTRPVIENDYVP